MPNDSENNSNFTVPKGWTRGKKLMLIGKGPRYAFMEAWTPANFDPNKVISGDDVGAVAFNSAEEALAFHTWWMS